MTWISRLLLRIARWIGGPVRAEWLNAMTAEAASIHGDSTVWAIGCAWASFKDRLTREWRFLLAILLLPVAVYVIGFAIFFPVVWLSHAIGLPNWTFVAVNLLLPLPFAFVLGRIRPGLPAYLALPVCFAISVFFPLVIFWIKFGKPSPFSWFGDGATWYMMSPAAGLSCSLLVWLTGTWLGSRSRRVNGSAGITG
jgi:hypothetical protein